MTLRRTAAILALLAVAAAEGAPAGDAAALLARQVALAGRLQHNDYGQPVYIESDEKGHDVGGDVYAVLPQPFALLARELAKPAPWCDVLILHLNVKRCIAGDDSLLLNLGRKVEQPIEFTYRLAFDDFTARIDEGYLRIRMRAADGPLGTHDYRVELEAVPSGSDGTFLHLRYAFSSSLTGRLLMQAYLLGFGSAKTGFTTVPAGNGAPARVGGARGAVERNAMRYYLAVRAYLATVALPPDARVERRLAAWFDATEDFPLQLHEIDRDVYLAMKRNELRRQAAP